MYTFAADLLLLRLNRKIEIAKKQRNRFNEPQRVRPAKQYANRSRIIILIIIKS